MKRLSFLFFVAIVACNRNPDATDLQANLKSAMINYLYSTINNDSSKVKYRIEGDVIYYNDKTNYDCEFKVKMITSGKTDTTGTMRAYVSKDFKEVKRTY